MSAWAAAMGIDESAAPLPAVAADSSHRLGAREKQAPNKGAQSAWNTWGFRKCSRLKVSHRSFCTGVPVKISLKRDLT